MAFKLFFICRNKLTLFCVLYQVFYTYGLILNLPIKVTMDILCKLIVFAIKYLHYRFVPFSMKLKSVFDPFQLLRPVEAYLPTLLQSLQVPTIFSFCDQLSPIITVIYSLILPHHYNSFQQGSFHFAISFSLDLLLMLTFIIFTKQISHLPCFYF